MLVVVSGSGHQYSPASRMHAFKESGELIAIDAANESEVGRAFTDPLANRLMIFAVIIVVAVVLVEVPCDLSGLQRPFRERHHDGHHCARGVSTFASLRHVVSFPRGMKAGCFGSRSRRGILTVVRSFPATQR